ncbi:MAG: trimethylamine methyltransferase family protein, partial [Desulforhopalus sp.]
NLIHDIGYLGQGLVGHPAALVICAEIISYVKRFARGFDIDDIDISMDVIREVGPQGGFIDTPHTFQNFRKEHWLPGLSNRLTLDNWKASGHQSLADKAIEKAKKILSEHEVAPFAEGVQEALNAIREAAVVDFGDKIFES